MKIQFPLRVLAMALLPLSFIACQSDTEPSPNYPENARLVRVLYYAGTQVQDNASVEEYEYDGEGKLIKTSRPLFRNGEKVGIAQYSIYEYDLQNRLVKTAFFNSNINEGFVNLKNILYSYDNQGIKEKEIIELSIPQKRGQ